MRALAAVVCACLTGCVASGGPSPSDVVVYAALDREFSEPILDEFTKTSSIRVLPKFDTESTKTVGLAEAILAESKRPRCDVFWNNEILHSIRLDRSGLLESHHPEVAASFPEMYRSPNGTWHGFAGRARILLVNTKRVPDDERPQSVYDLLDPKWNGKIGLAKPLFGTTATHAACLFAYLGPAKAREYFVKLKANGVQILSGNKQVAEAVASGQIAFGLTDTDDAIVELDQGHPVAIVYPDRNDDQMGTLFIPNTLCIIKNSPHPDNAKKLVDYLLSPEVEIRLARSASAQIPLNSTIDVPLRVESPRTVKAMPVDFAAAAEQWETARNFMRDEFTGE